MSEAHADPEIPGGHDVQPGTGLSTSVLKQLTQLVLGDARDAGDIKRLTYGYRDRNSVYKDVMATRCFPMWKMFL